MSQTVLVEGTAPDWTGYVVAGPQNSPEIQFVGSHTLDFTTLFGTFLIEWDTYGTTGADPVPDHSTVTFLQQKTDNNGSVSTLYVGSYAPGDASSVSLSNVFLSATPACTSQCVVVIATAGTAAGGCRVAFAPLNLPPASPTSNWPVYTQMLDRTTATTEIFITRIL